MGETEEGCYLDESCFSNQVEGYLIDKFTVILLCLAYSGLLASVRAQVATLFRHRL